MSTEQIYGTSKSLRDRKGSKNELTALLEGIKYAFGSPEGRAILLETLKQPRRMSQSEIQAIKDRAASQSQPQTSTQASPGVTINLNLGAQDAQSTQATAPARTQAQPAQAKIQAALSPEQQQAILQRVQAQKQKGMGTAGAGTSQTAQPQMSDNYKRFLTWLGQGTKK